MTQSEEFVDGICTCDEICALCRGAGDEAGDDAKAQYHKKAALAVVAYCYSRQFALDTDHS